MRHASLGGGCVLLSIAGVRDPSGDYVGFNLNLVMISLSLSLSNKEVSHAARKYHNA